jgi:hypothetical protein
LEAFFAGGRKDRRRKLPLGQTEENWRAMDPKQSYDTVAVFDLKDPDKKIADVIVKNEGLSMRHGVFTYYDPRSGKLLAKETYVMNKLQEDDSTEGAIKKPIEKK